MNAKASEMLSLEPNLSIGAVKGSKLAGGAVAIYLSPEYVTILQYDISVGGKVRIIFDAGRRPDARPPLPLWKNPSFMDTL